MTETMLELRDVHKAFASKKVLNGVNIDVSKGQSLVIIGGSGTGKSVTLKCALGLLTPDQGEVLFNGKPVGVQYVQAQKEMMARTGMLFQGGALFDSLPVWQNIAFHLLHNENMKRTEAKDRAIDTLKKVRLGSDVANQYPSELSGGMQKRVSLARAVITNPDLIFFDEPTTGLDPITADAINDLILEQTKTLGAASLTITHDMASARKIADDIAMIYDGQIIWRGKASDVDQSENEYVDQFVHGRADGPIQPAI